MQMIDNFDDIAPWRASTSDDVKATLRRGQGTSGNALCMDFDFGAVSGYAVARRELALAYPDNYEFSFDLRWEAPANTLQFKLLDSSGENVWWATRADYTSSREWQHVRFKKRHLTFAWGPAKDHRLKHSAVLELVVARGRGGGKGTVCFDRLAFRELPSDSGIPRPTPVLRASSTLTPGDAAQAVDGRLETAWHSDPRAGPEQTLTLDFRTPREFGGLVLHWLPDAFASRYSIDFSDDGAHWHTVRSIVAGNGGIDPHFMPESETRYVRLRLQDGPAKAYALAEIEVKDLAYGASPNAFFAAIAKAAPRGNYPRAFAGEQSYWTVVGVDGGLRQGLLSEDGALEIGPHSASVEPFLLTNRGIVTWADVATEHSLRDGYLPIPTVTWRHPDLTMRMTAFGTGNSRRSQLISRYTIENRSDRPQVVRLILAIRPSQVNPPTQFLNTPGGVTPVRDIAWDGHALSINGRRRLFPLQRPDRVLAAAFESGNIPELVAQLPHLSSSMVKDETGFASALLLYRLELPPRSNRAIAIVAPLTGEPTLPKDDAITWSLRQEAEVASVWREETNRVLLHLPPARRNLADTVRTALAHILINRAGAALQPGVRAYARSWIRDGAIMSDALRRLGHANIPREFIEWFAAHQFASGKVPCCIDGRGADPVAENDSHGAFIYLIAEQFRYTHDRDWLQSMWPHVVAAADYMDSLRLSERTAQNQTANRRAFYGLMPASISHEGYSDRPAYSYWDDFWTLAGYDGAVAAAKALNRDRDARRLADKRTTFSRDLQASLRSSIALHGIDYIPGSADRGDFDPASTTIALSIAGQQTTLPQRQLRQTFERYWHKFVARRDGATAWDVYTPYELRVVGAFVRLGERARAGQVLAYLLGGRRPPGWNQWAEVVGRDARRPRFVGDMPHAWIAADFIQSVLDLFAYERATDQALVLAAGIPEDWLIDQDVGVENLRTPYGELSYTLRRDGHRLLLRIAGGITPPRGGLVFRWPYPGTPGSASINGIPCQWEKNKELRIHTVPAELAIDTTPVRGD